MPLKDAVARRAYMRDYKEANRERINEQSAASARRNYTPASKQALAVWRKANPEKRKRYANRPRLKQYGIDFLTYSALLICQSGRCSCCNVPLRKPYVDHDHSDNKVRGLVCTNCNIILGHAHDSTPVLAACITYLEKFNG